MPTVLEVKDLQHMYGDTVALGGVSLSVEPGELVALLGPNGAGKTTLVRSVIGLIDPTSGSLAVAGGNPARAGIRRRLGVVQQDVGFPRTLRVGEVVEGAAARVGADKTAAESAMREMGLADQRNQKAANLSGGQQQRLQLAMGLVTDPALLVLDEPTSGLDVSSRRTFWEALEERRHQGVGVLLTTHIVEEAASVADRVVVLDRGVVVAEGTPTELKRILPGRRISARTSLPVGTIRALDGVMTVAAENGEVAIGATEAEPVVRALLDLDKTLSELVVATASLDEVLLELTGDKKEVAA